MPTVLITLPHFAASSVVNLPNSAGTHDHGLGSQIGEFLLHLRIAQHGIYLCIELVDDVRRGFGRGADAVPDDGLIARHKLGDGGNVRQHFGARVVRHSQCPQLASADEADRLQDRRERRLHLAAKQIGQIAATIRHVHHVNVGHHVEQFAGHVGRGAAADRSEVYLAGVFLRVVDELRQRLGRHRRVDHKHERQQHQARDRHQVAEEVEVELVVERHVEHVGHGRGEQRVAVRRRFHDDLGADIGGAARPIVDDELLLEPLRQPLSDEPRGNVGRDSDRIRYDHADRPRRIGLRRHRLGQARQRGHGRSEPQHVSTRKFHHSLSFTRVRHSLTHSSLSVCLGAGKFDYFGPLSGFLGEKFPKLRG